MDELSTDPPSRLYSRVPPIVWVLGGIILATTAIVAVLNLGGETQRSESAGDLTYLEGDARPRRQKGGLVASIADVTHAEVRRDGTQLVFSARVATTLPHPLKISALQFRWDISSEDDATWTVTAMIGRTTQASVFSSTGFGAGTVDDTLPGAITVSEDAIEVALDTAALPEFPAAFDWSVTTTLRAFRDEPDSPRVEDRFPDEGAQTVEV